MMRRAFITGITGFIGQPLARLLSEHGFAVSGIARNPKEMEFARVLPGDVMDPDSYRAEVARADVIVHLAAPTVASYIASHPQETMTVNVSGLLNLLNCFQEGGGQHLVAVSTGKVYGPSRNLPYREDHPLSPVGALGKSKLIAEEMVRFFSDNCKQAGRTYSVLRLFNSYGPRQHGDFLIPTIMEQIAGGKVVLGDIAGRRDFIFVDDAVSGIDAVIAAGVGKDKFNIYNLGTGKSYSPADLVRFFEEIIGKKLPLETDPNRVRRGEPDDERADTSRLNELGWATRIEIADGLARTWRARADAVGSPA